MLVAREGARSFRDLPLAQDCVGWRDTVAEAMLIAGQSPRRRPSHRMPLCREPPSQKHAYFTYHRSAEP